MSPIDPRPEGYLRSDDILELAAALAIAQGEIEGAPKDSANPFFRSSYADLASVWGVIRKPLSANGLAVLQFPATGEPRNIIVPERAVRDGQNNTRIVPEHAETIIDVTITTLLVHKSGQWISSDLKVTAREDTPQAVGSAITYGRRYALQSIIGVAPEEDDGNSASARGSQPAARQPAPAPASHPTRQEQVAAQEEVRDKKLQALIEEALAKLLARFRAVDAEAQFGEIMGAYGYTAIKDVPAKRETAKRLVDDLRLRVEGLEKKE